MTTLRDVLLENIGVLFETAYIPEGISGADLLHNMEAMGEGMLVELAAPAALIGDELHVKSRRMTGNGVLTRRQETRGWNV